MYNKVVSGTTWFGFVAALAEPVSRPARTSLRRCRQRSRSRPSHRWPRSRQLRGPCRQQPGRGVQRGGFSRPAQAEPVTPPARTSLRRCRRCGQGLRLNVHTQNPILRSTVHTVKQVLRRMNTCHIQLLIHCSYSVHTVFTQQSRVHAVFGRF